jgi:RNA polymerase sigma-70 factor (ECF subfamily)
MISGTFLRLPANPIRKRVACVESKVGMDLGRDDSTESPTQRQDDELLRQLSRGSEAAWSEFYARYQARVYRFALQMTGSRPLAEEAVQETFLALLDRAVRFDPGKGTLAGYLFGIARNKVRGLLERERGYTALEDSYDAAAPDNTHAALTEREETERVRQAVLALPANYREVVVLCDLQQLDYAQAGAVIGCAIGTVRSRLHRGRQLLAEKLSRVVARG